MNEGRMPRAISNVSFANSAYSSLIGHDNQSDTEWGYRTDYGITEFEIRLAAGLAFMLISMIACACAYACKIWHAEGLGCSLNLCHQGYKHLDTEGDEDEPNLDHENGISRSEETVGIELT